ncbi:MAG TPA: hypothetical protein VGF15_07695 [Solirubrobacteraceae bacterium]
MSSLDRLVVFLREQGGLIASLLPAGSPTKPPSDAEPGPAQLAGAGPRAADHREQYELLIETIYEGYLLHYEQPRVVCSADQDLRLLVGDQLYALGLSRLVALGDVAAVAELADVITLSALANGARDGELARATWRAGARVVGWGASDSYTRAKELAFAGAPQAIEAMRTSIGS